MKKATPKKTNKTKTDNTKSKKELYKNEDEGNETPEVRTTKMRSGEKDTDIYTEEGRDLLEEDDEIEPWEEGFAQGASGEGRLGKDALTGEPLMGADNIIEAEIDGQLYRFVSEKNAISFQKKKELEKRKKK